MRRTIKLGGLFGILLFLLVTGTVAHANLGPLSVSFIDVGQGDSILLRAPDGTDILIDGGKPGAGPTVVAYLLDQNVDDIEVMVVSHPHEDHIGGLIDVLESAIPVKAVVYGRPGTTATYDDFVSAMQVDGLTPTPVAEGQDFTWGPMSVEVSNPQSPPLSDTNEDSVVLLISYGDHEFLFTGDIGSSAESAILASGESVAADVLKVAHHGSKYSSTSTFLNAVSPTYAVISVGDNPYGHPAQETLDRLDAVGAEVYRTDLLATVVITSDGTALWTNQPQTPSPTIYIFLPLVQREIPPKPTPTPGPSPTPKTPPAPNMDVNITEIHYDGDVPYVESDEYAVIRNDGNVVVSLEGWRLNAGAPGQDFYFPDFQFELGQECRVYTNENHPEFCGFSFESSSALWNNSGDCGYLYDGSGSLVSEYCY
jgi:beta-lactamase superfamily II metal-dependent hydrolase